MSEWRTNVWSHTASYQGKWWATEDPNTKFEGSLSFEDRRPRLTLASPLSGQTVFRLGDPPMLHGLLNSGEKVTLWDQGEHALRFLRNEGELMLNARRFSYAVLGAHLDHHDKQLFRFSAYQLHGVGIWSAMDSPIPRDIAEEELPQYEPAKLTNFHRDKSGVRYSATVHLEDFRRITSDSRYAGGSIVRHIHTGDNARVVFECFPPAPAEVHDLLLFDLQSLLTFSYQGAAPVEHEWLAPESIQDSVSVMRPDRLRGHKPRGHVFRQTMVLTTEATTPRRLFPAWWRAIDALYPATQVITLYNQGSRGPLESSVASAIAVVERLHELVGPTTTRFEEGFLESRKPEIKKAFPGADNARFRAFLYEAMQNNRPALATRLKEVVSAVSVKRMLSMGIDPDSWIADIRSVRDLLAHTSSHVDRRDNDAAFLLERVNGETRAVVTILILALMKIEPQVMDSAAETLRQELDRLKKRHPNQ